TRETRVEALLVRAAVGERDDAVQELLQMQAKWPKFRSAKLWAVTLLRRTDPARAVVLASELLAAVPDNAIVEGTLAGVLRRAGALDESWRHIQSVLRRRPAHGNWHGVAARIALARGDVAAAAAALARAERLDPGGTVSVVARAEFDVLTS